MNNRVQNIQNLVRKNILKLQPYTSARSEYSGSSGVFLDANENPWGEYNRYPDPLQKALKQKLATLHDCSTEQIFIGNGSDEIIDLAFRIFCEPQQDQALSFTPSYGMYEVSAQIHDIEMIQISLNSDFQIDIEKVIPHLDNPNIKLLFICSPNNPTGNSFCSKDIRFILDHFQGITIIDEAYIDFSIQPSWLNELKNYPKLIISQTLSKAWGAAGIRLGIGYMNPAIAQWYNQVKSPYNISTVCQEIALHILDEQETFHKHKQEIMAQKEYMLQALQNLPCVIQVYPSDANFFLIKVENAPELYQKLIENKIVVRNRNHIIPNSLRITIGTAEENRQLIQTLQKISYA